MPDVLTGVPATMATTHRWLAGRVARSAAVWRIDRPRPAETTRAAGTLWWSMSAYTLLAGPIAAFLAGIEAPDPALSRCRIALGPDGEIDAVDYDATIPARTLGRALALMAASVIAPLTDVCGASRRSLWAITSDALANGMLDQADRPTDGVAAAYRLAEAIGSVLPRPRFVTRAGRVVVRRSSCCLSYCSLRRGADNCAACPRRSPDERSDPGVASALC